jgi:hypothetical protein
MKEFVKSLFSDKDGSVSSKRLVMFALVFTFLGIVFVNLFWEKIVEDGLLNSLVTLIWATLGSVFGENVTNVFSRKPDPK